MRIIDRILQSWRIRHAIRFLAKNVRVIDIGAHQGELFHALGGRLKEGFGVEPLLGVRITASNYIIEKGFFPIVKPDTSDWDAITMLAVLEHIPPPDQIPLAEACHNLLRTGGHLIITVPSPAVDHILAILKYFRLIDGMSLEEHYGFSPRETTTIFERAGFKLLDHSRFQFGLNHVFVFEK